MSILKIAKIGHPVLLKKSEPVKKIQKEELKRLIIDMTHTLLDANGIGLAAPQIYINKRIILFRSQSINGEKTKKKKIEITPLINPSYINSSDEFEDDWEGCLSIPGMLGKVRRFKKIIYKGYNLQGKLLKNLRVFEVEIFHTDGEFFLYEIQSKLGIRMRTHKVLTQISP